MLGKLIKYEWKACARSCAPLYLAVLLLAFVNRIMIAIRPDSFMETMPMLITSFAYFGVMVAMFVVTFVILIQRFYKNLLGSEGYLMMTLPVSITQHIWSKAIVAFVMNALCAFAAILSIFIMGADKETLRGMSVFFGEFFQAVTTDANVILVAIELFVLVVLSGFASILYMYVCMAIGHLAKKHRVAASIGAYFAINVITQIVFSLLVALTDNASLLNFFTGLGETAMVHTAILGLCVLAAIPGTIYFVITKHILKNKLNLE